MSDLPPDLEAFLARPPQSATESFREEVLDDTLAVLSRRRSQWQVKWFVAAWVVPVLLLAIWSLARTRMAVDKAAPPAPLPPRIENVEPPATPPSPPDAQELEWQAFDSPRNLRSKLYWQAGQAYVALTGDYVSAVRCFRQALDAGPPEFLQITAEDDFLTMALKIERTRKENADVVP